MPPSRTRLLCTSFGCLAAGLEYLHSTKVRHKDIKPENILVHGETVLYTDFGIALDWAAIGRSTTEETAPRMTRLYSAPEFLQDEPRNSPANVWC
jgi:serine/threonine protein kinase